MTPKSKKIQLQILHHLDRTLNIITNAIITPIITSVKPTAYQKRTFGVFILPFAYWRYFGSDPSIKSNACSEAALKISGCVVTIGKAFPSSSTGCSAFNIYLFNLASKFNSLDPPGRINVLSTKVSSSTNGNGVSTGRID